MIHSQPKPPHLSNKNKKDEHQQPQNIPIEGRVGFLNLPIKFKICTTNFGHPKLKT